MSPSPSAMLPLTLFTLAAVAVLLWGEARAHDPTRRVAKPLASLGFITVAIAAGALDGDYGRAVLVALVLCAIGDVCLLSRADGWFLAGLGAFLLGHVAFAAAFLIQGVAVGWVLSSGVALVGIALIVRRWLTPYVPGGMRVSVDAYIIVITAMVALSAGATAAGGTPRIAAGAVAFFLSDLSVARERFVRPGLVNRLWGLPMYYGAQLVLASTIVAH
ncbi:MAG: lysoplasmalogenase [Deltaproteobacteria bacterium]|nr:lysoplasmalogenase [Deltaproteobacteria bacterium]